MKLKRIEQICYKDCQKYVHPTSNLRYMNNLLYMNQSEILHIIGIINLRFYHTNFSSLKTIYSFTKCKQVLGTIKQLRI